MDFFETIDKEFALFAGAGGGLLGSKILGLQTVGAVEVEKYPCGVLLQRQNDGSLDTFPIWTDIRSFTKRNNECRPYIRQLRRMAYRLLISGGFPCQDISVAGTGKGLDGENSGLWREYIRVVCEIRPAGVYVENSPMLLSRGIDRVLKDLAEVGYNAVWGVLGASDVGANHYRKRIWILAYNNNLRRNRRQQKAYQREKHKQKHRQEIWDKTDSANRTTGAGQEITTDTGQFNDDHTGFRTGEISQLEASEIFGNISDSNRLIAQRLEQEPQTGEFQRQAGLQSGKGNKRGWKWWTLEPGLDRVAHGVAYRVDRIKSIGNGQVPAAMAGAFYLLHEIIRSFETRTWNDWERKKED